MGYRRGLIAAVAAPVVGAGALSGCVTNVDTPATFAAMVTITGDADEARVDSGECVWAGAAHLVPGYVVSISAGSAATTATALDIDCSELLLVTGRPRQAPDGVASAR